MPLIRAKPGECGSVSGLSRWLASRVILAGPLREADEEALIRREAVDRLQLLVLGRMLPRHVRDQRAAQVGNVFPAGELAVDVDVVDDDVGRKLVAQAVDALFEVLRILLRPPVLQVAFGVELPPFVVEAVRQLMADGGARVAVVRRVVRLRGS